MDKFHKIEGHVGVVKDPNVGAILSTDSDALKSFKNKKKKQKEQDARIQQLESKLANMEVLLEKILEKL